MNGTETLGEQREPIFHLAAAKTKWNQKINDIVAKYFYRCQPFVKMGKKSGAIYKECSKNEMKRYCLKSLNNDDVIKKS